MWFSRRSQSTTSIVEAFHRLYYEAGLQTWGNTFWRGVRTLKCPLDLWIYQEIIFETKPDVIIECGTAHGGSALFLASICEQVGTGRVITIDVEAYEGRPEAVRLTSVHGSSIADEVVADVRSQLRAGDKVMVILDSDHHKEHVLRELTIYGGLVTRGNYLVVEDTNINKHPVFRRFGPGPMEAVTEFLRVNRDFVVDQEREKFYLTFNPGGYLLRIR